MDTKQTCYIGFMYRIPNPGIFLDRVIKCTTGARYVHVDCVFIPSESMDVAELLKPWPERYGLEKMEREKHVMKLLFSIHIHETFGYYVAKEWDLRDDETHSMQILEVQEEELINAWKYFMELSSAKIPYNTMDLMLCTLPNIISRDFLCDVDDTKLPSKVFCSQAMVLMLKHAMQPGNFFPLFSWVLNVTGSYWESF